ncbi:hypothetical protein L6452_21630 [Arctium lappa]|uniref:Uncharacterized protein n=1 Tax=Arctium lappa TaxID=4217 RepID=A0ACB9AYV8_ARCLA|nr:hypothetical protein L6452_21630 [Arctium lappa]
MLRIAEGNTFHNISLPKCSQEFILNFGFKVWKLTLRSNSVRLHTRGNPSEKLLVMMNYRFTFKNTRPKSSTTKHTFHFALFVVFALWLLYEIGQSYSKKSVIDETFLIHLNQERFSHMFGRKGHVKHRVDSNKILDDVTNPGELTEVDFGIKEHNGGNDEKELTFDGVKEQESLSTTMLTKMKSNNPDLITHSFPDENGIPELVRDKFVGNESTQSERVSSIR